MRCVTYCIPSSYKITPLFESLKSHFVPTLYRDVIYFRYYSGEVFIFPYGSTICWDVSPEHRQQLLEEIKPFADNPNKTDVEFDEFSFSEDGKETRIQEDHISLESGDVLTKLAISHALAQAIKLTVFENSIQRIINNTKHLAEDLARTGKIGLSRKEIAQKRGSLFIARSSINLHTDILDRPEFFWEYPDFEPMYMSVANYLELFVRVDVLNKRVDIVHDLFQMLGDQLHNQHSIHLEWIVICLIFIEVILGLLEHPWNIG